MHSPTAVDAVHREGSLRSVASNASLGAGSLTRRSRTRTRSKTMSSSPRFDPDPLWAAPISPQLYGDQPLQGDPNKEGDRDNSPGTFADQTEIASKQSKAATQAHRPPGISTNQLIPSAFSRVPSIPQLYDLGGDARDLGSQEYDGDDVSYRLRLLVKNNYFLPPAHSKPSSSDFAVTLNAKKASRPPPTPTFFDIFRKSRSKPSTPTGSAQAFDLLTPVLRTTSDSTTASGYAPQMPRRRSSSQTPGVHRGHRDVDIIDPTDTVDLPPPSAAYPFAVQAAALHGMGVQDSVGAAALADRLPPRSPGAFSVEDDWRKALLHAAVDHSLNNASGVFSSPTQAKTSTSASENRVIGQRIISPPLSDSVDELHPPVDVQVNPLVTLEIPLMCLEHTLMPLTPLAPPPRRQLVNPLYSLSQTSLPITSTPRLSDSYESGVRHALMSPPPPISRESSEETNLGEPRPSFSSGSFYSHDDEGMPRPSMSSTIPDTRPSISLYSQPSPTTSAFQDALTRGPPALNPPPRGSSLRRSSETPSRMPPPVPLSRASSEVPEILDPGPTTPPYPVSVRRGTAPLVLEIPTTHIKPGIRSAPAPSSPPSFFDSIQNQPNAMDDLDSSSDEDDAYQDHHEPPHTPIYINPRTQAVSNVPSSAASSSRSLLMRLGNHSTPYVSRSSDGHGSAGVPASKMPVANIPATSSFFTERRHGKSEQGHGPPTSTFDFYQYAQQNPLASAAEPSASRRPHTADKDVRAWQTTQRDQESLKRLDGMLIQHMEAEKDTIKRIATNLHSNAKS
ncbi:hypothetical protein B0H10DRAFT_2024460 [Mycena sp. CBHHK59/15]|nr:hypothetical protein B0H10DRAFT_2024460 [Mycena sp. CBHHK59/15]